MEIKSHEFKFAKTMKYNISLKEALSGLEKVFAKQFLDIDIQSAESLNVEFPKIEEKEADYTFKAVTDEQKLSLRDCML